MTRSTRSLFSPKTLLCIGMVIAVGIVATNVWAKAPGVRHDTPCSPVAGYHSYEQPPSFVKHPEKNASCKDCRPIARGTSCHIWWGGQTPGGGSSVSHKGWPGVTGIHFQVISNTNRGAHRRGTQFNDELLGRNGSDSLSGGIGHDIIWGDSNAQYNGTSQRDRLSGGAGNDWLYASHGYNYIGAGSGNDRITAYFGHGTVDCGPGNDTVEVAHKSTYRLQHCERITHPGSW